MLHPGLRMIFGPMIVGPRGQTRFAHPTVRASAAMQVLAVVVRRRRRCPPTAGSEQRDASKPHRNTLRPHDAEKQSRCHKSALPPSAPQGSLSLLTFFVETKKVRLRPARAHRQCKESAGATQSEHFTKSPTTPESPHPPGTRQTTAQPAQTPPTNNAKPTTSTHKKAGKRRPFFHIANQHNPLS